MRLTRLGGGARSDNALLLDAVKAVGFFPGPRAVQVDQATDGLTPVFEAALADWQPGDAQIIVTAGAAKRSSLSKLFEGSKTAYVAAIYDDPPGRAEIEDLLKAPVSRRGPRRDGRSGNAGANAFGRGFPPDHRQARPLQTRRRQPRFAADLEAVAPLSREAELDDILHATAEAASGSIGPILSRLKAQGVAPVTLCIAALRHFRALHAAACHPGGAEAGLSAQRPPVFGPAGIG
jgi:DNA polymerase-3 subunit delta